MEELGDRMNQNEQENADLNEDDDDLWCFNIYQHLYLTISKLGPTLEITQLFTLFHPLPMHLQASLCTSTA